jgi:NADH-quinone oxidoreductase subunit J
VSGLWEQIAFYSLALLTLVPAALVVTSRNIVHAGYWLLPTFLGVAGLFAALEAHFLFVAQLLIYAGAILVLILFALMLTRDVMNANVPQTNRLTGWAGMICAALIVGSSVALTHQGWHTADAVPLGATEQTRELGAQLIGLYAIPFEVSSLLLLAALIGAVVLAKSEREPEVQPALLAMPEELGLEL